MRQIVLSLSAGMLSIAVYWLLAGILPLSSSWATAVGCGIGSGIGSYFILQKKNRS